MRAPPAKSDADALVPAHPAIDRVAIGEIVGADDCEPGEILPRQIAERPSQPLDQAIRVLGRQPLVIVADVKIAAMPPPMVAYDVGRR